MTKLDVYKNAIDFGVGTVGVNNKDFLSKALDSFNAGNFPHTEFDYWIEIAQQTRAKAEELTKKVVKPQATVEPPTTI